MISSGRNGSPWQLEEAGYTAVFQAWDFRPGSNFVLEMDRAAKDSERVIAVLSDDYLKARYTSPEWAVAFRDDPTGEKRKLVHVRVRECDVKGLLGPVVYIDLVGLEEQEAKAVLIDGLSRKRSKPATPPHFPIAVHRSVTVRPPFPFEVAMDAAMDITVKSGTLLEERMKAILEMENLHEEKARLREKSQPAIAMHFIDQKLEELNRRIETLDVQIEKLSEQRKLAMKTMEKINEAGSKAMQEIWRDKK